MPTWVFGIEVIAFIVALLIALQIYSNIQLRKKVQMNKGRFPRVVGGKDSEKSLREAFATSPKKSAVIDDLTWHDLNGFAIFQMINQTYSSIGSEALYQQLRSYSFKEDFSQEKLIDFYQTHPKELEDIQVAFAKLGKKDYNFLQQYLNEPTKKVISTKGVGLLSALPLISIALLFFVPELAVLLLLFSLIFNVVYYFKMKNKLETELLSMSYLVQMISCGKRISRLHSPYEDKLKKLMAKLGKITTYAFSFSPKTNSEGEIFVEYLNMIFLLPFLSYNLVLDSLKSHQKEAQELWQLLADLEVAGAILNFRTIMPYVTKPTFTKEFKVTGENLYHPLIKEPVANDVSWGKATLVTGSNASGKSTYVKSVALNCLLAQTIHTTLAESFTLPRGLVITSMAIEDNLFKGESYFIAEIKSLKRMIQKVEQGIPCLCFIDEILKGTNTIERIAASSSILNWLQKQAKNLSYVATHDIELTEILKDSVENIHFSEVVTEEGISFDYLLKEGPATSKNALALLESLGYPEVITQQAKKEATAFEKSRIWQMLS